MTLQATLTTAGNVWKAYDQWIQEDADRAAYTAASPENALVLVGPNRAPAENLASALTPIGLVQNFTIGQTINWQAQQMIGSGRTFFLAGKAPGNGSMTRLFTSSHTLLGAIYKQVWAKIGGDPGLESKAYGERKEIMFTLDTELLKIPVGMACLFRDTSRNFIGGFYVEQMVIPNINLGFAVGQPAIFETVNIMFDRVIPFDISNIVTIAPSMASDFDKAMNLA
jgi:hypothetical protein